MSDISKVDAKESLDIPEDQEVIDASNYENIQLDKTSVETYVNDFNKNFYKIKFSKKLLTDYYELYKLENYGINTKDINETVVDEVNNATKDNKQIQPTPVGLPGVISYKNNSSNVIRTNLVKTDEISLPCVGISYTPNLSTSFSDDNWKWTIKSGNLKNPIDLNVSIPPFRIASPNIDLKAFGVRIAYSSDCDEERKKTLYHGTTIGCGTYVDEKCVRGLFGKLCYDTTFFKSKDQIYFADHTYSPKELMNFNGLGVKFNAAIDASFEIQFQLATNIPVGTMMQALSNINSAMYQKATSKSISNVNDIINTLTENTDFESILDIMKKMIMATANITVNDPYIDFYITYVGVNLNFLVNNFRVNYGANIYEQSGQSSHNTSFNLLGPGQYISFALNPESLEITAEFVLFEGSLHNLLHSLSSANTKKYLTDNVTPKGITGLLLAIIIIARENIEKNSDKIRLIMARPPGAPVPIAEREGGENKQNLEAKNTTLQSTINSILKIYDEFKTTHYGNSSNPISKIIDKINPTIKLSMMLCTADGIAAFVGCVAVTLPKIDIIQFVEDSVENIINALPNLNFASKIPRKFETSPLLTVSNKNKIRKFNDDVDKVNNELNNGILNSLNAVLNMLQNQLYVSPTAQFCLPI